MRPISLDLGNPNRDPPHSALDIVGKASFVASGYAPQFGLDELRNAIAQHSCHTHGPAKPEQVVVTVGASAGLFAVLAAVSCRESSILVPNPGYPAYRSLARILGVQAIPYDFGNLKCLDSMRNAVRSDTKAIIWNSPANPTGVVASRECVESVVTFADDHDLHLVSDEVYSELVYEGEHIGPAAVAGYDQITCVGSFSKSYALAGWRVGYTVSSAELAKKICRIHWTTNMCPPLVGQVVATACLCSAKEYVADVTRSLREKRDFVVRSLSTLGIPCTHPQAGIFVWFDISPFDDQPDSFVSNLGMEKRLYVMSGTNFEVQTNSHCRMLLDVSWEDLREALDRISDYVSQRQTQSSYTLTGASQ